MVWCRCVRVVYSDCCMWLSCVVVLDCTSADCCHQCGACVVVCGANVIFDVVASCVLCRRPDGGRNDRYQPIDYRQRVQRG